MTTKRRVPRPEIPPKRRIGTNRECLNRTLPLARGATLYYALGRRRVLDEEEGIKTRWLTAVIEASGESVGAIRLVEWSLASWVDEFTFLDMADSRDQDDNDMAAAVVSAWKIPDDLGGCRYLLFEYAWMKPRFNDHALWADAANGVIAKHFRECVMLVLQAAPLEDNDDADLFPTEEQRLFRRRAMMRHYRRLLGAPATARRGWRGRLAVAPFKRLGA